MGLNGFGGRRGVILALALGTVGMAQSTLAAMAQAEFKIAPVAEKRVAELPAGPLYWQIENFPTRAEAEAAAGPLSLAAEVDGKAWLFTLGPEGAPTRGGTIVAEVGPLEEVTAPEYLLSIREGVAPTGAKTMIHTHPGTEAFYVLDGQLSFRTKPGVEVVDAGKTLAGVGPDTPMEASSTGTTDLHELIMFVVDPAKPFASPAVLE
jgi:quercetin dioxygenase-like cupin family protein